MSEIRTDRMAELIANFNTNWGWTASEAFEVYDEITRLGSVVENLLNEVESVGGLWSQAKEDKEILQVKNAELRGEYERTKQALLYCVNVLEEPGIIDVDIWENLKKRTLINAHFCLDKQTIEAAESAGKETP